MNALVMICAAAIAAAPASNDVDMAKFMQIRAAGPVSESVDDLFWNRDGGTNLCLKLSGRVRDAFTDERDEKFRFLVIDSTNGMFYAAVYDDRLDEKTLAGMAGAVVSVCGIQDHGGPYNPRKMLGPHLLVLSADDVKVVSPGPKDPFDVPELHYFYGPRPEDVPERRRNCVRGYVLAVWRRNRLLLSTDSGLGFLALTVKVTLAGDDAPRAGDSIEAAGFVETDLYHLNLSRAVWRRCAPCAAPNIEPVSVRADDILEEKRGRRLVKTDFHGRTLKLRGVVQSPPGADGRMFVQDGDTLVPVELGEATAEVRADAGAEVEVTGVCVLEIENWRPSAVFPQVDGFFLVVRGPEDVVVVRPPPWWTPAKFIALIAALAAILVTLALWNVSLRVLAERRGRRLAVEQIRREKSVLKTQERTRLAIELHDLLSQSLTGISYAVATAGRLSERDPAAARSSLGIAAKSLASCREELRNCLWDLRSRTLEERDFAEAIRKTLTPHLGAAVLAVRFRVPRAQLTDSVAHSVLSILRELATNAVRHGGASKIDIAGAMDGGRLSFSLADDGRGFDPDAAPGYREGHYGLLGVRERVSSMEGSVEIESAPGRGTKVTVRIDVDKGEIKDRKETE